MRSRTAEWFECKVRCERMNENGETKKVIDLYTVNALSFTEAEARITGHLANYIDGKTMEVLAITRAPYREVFFPDDEETADRFYKVKIKFIMLDERTGKEKKIPVVYLFNAASFEKASALIKEFQTTCLQDFEKTSITETKIVDIIEVINERSAITESNITESIEQPTSI